MAGEDLLSLAGDLGSEGAAFGGGYSLGAGGLDAALPGLSFPEQAATLPAPPTSAPASLWGDIRSGASDLAGIARGIAPVAQIGTAVGGLVRGGQAASQAAEQTKMLKRAQESQQAVTQPLVTFGTQELQRGQAGQLDPAYQAVIDNWKQGAKQKIQAFYAKIGMGQSSALQEELNLIDQQGEAMKAQMLGQMQSTGVTALGQAGQTATSAAGTASTQQQQLEQLIAEANKALGSLAGSTS